MPKGGEGGSWCPKEHSSRCRGEIGRWAWKEKVAPFFWGKYHVQGVVEGGGQRTDDSKTHDQEFGLSGQQGLLKTIGHITNYQRNANQNHSEYHLTLVRMVIKKSLQDLPGRFCTSPAEDPGLIPGHRSSAYCVVWPKSKETKHVAKKQRNKKSTNSKFWRGCGAKGAFLHC